MPKFTERILNDMFLQGKDCNPKEKKFFIHGYKEDRTGFAICIYPTGTKTWFFIYNYKGKKCFMPLGKYPVVGVAKAGKLFEENWQLLQSGRNPATAKEEDLAKEEAAAAAEKALLQAAQAEEDANLTVKQLVTEYLERHAVNKKSGGDEDRRILEKDLLGISRPRKSGQREDRKGAVNWSDRKAKDITKKDIKNLNKIVLNAGSPNMANNTFKVIRKMFNWAVVEDLLEISPCVGIKLPYTPETNKITIDDADDIKAFWDALDGGFAGLSMSKGVNAALRLILVTAQRPGEVSGMHTKEIKGNWWTIPKERSKNKKAHRVFLSPLAQEIINKNIDAVKILKETPEGQKYSGYIFPGVAQKNKDKDRPIDRHALSKALQRNRSEDGLTTLGVKTFTPHDLRRTATTLMAKCKIVKEHRERVLNHTPEKLDGTYNQHDYDDEKQIALETLARKITSIVTGTKSNVIPFQQASGGN